MKTYFLCDSRQQAKPDNNRSLFIRLDDSNEIYAHINIHWCKHKHAELTKYS